MRILKIICLVFILLSLALFIGATDFKMAFAALAAAGPAMFALVILVTALAYFAGAAGWIYCFAKEYRGLSLWRLFMIRHVGETISLINPAGIIGGEALKIFLLSRDAVPAAAVTASVLVSRILMALTQILLFLFAFIWLQGTVINFNATGGYTLLLAVMVLVTVIVFFVRHQKWIPGNVQLKITPVKGLIRQKLQSIKTHIKTAFGDTMRFFSGNRRAVWMAIFFFMLHWVTGSLEFLIILRYLGIDISVVHSLLMDMGVIFFKAAGVFIPAQAGAEELGNKMMLATAGKAAAGVWLTVSMIKRLRQLFWIIIGLALYWLIYKRQAGLITAA
jgi:glycosyltransferase 2 family protein